MRRWFPPVVLSLVASHAHAATPACRPAEGDLVFQSLPHGERVEAIEGISGSRSPTSGS